MPFTPTNYTTTPANTNPNLIEHLAGIDAALANAGADLAWANQNATTGQVTSSTGTAATLTAATAALAGLMTAAQFTVVDNLPTIPAAIGAAGQILQVNAGATALEYVAAPTGVTNLGYTPAAGQGTVTSSTGGSATLPLVDGTNAGLMAPADFTKLGQVPALGTAGQELRVNAGATALEYYTPANDTLAYAQAAADNTITISGSGSVATILPATTALSGLMVPAQFDKLANITVTAATDLDAIRTQQGELVTLSGVPANSTDFGTFTGALLTDNLALKPLLQELETAVEAIPSRVQGVDASIAVRDARTGSQVGDIVYVSDASADATVTAGGAGYIWDGAQWVKFAEAESLEIQTNLGVANITPTGFDVTSSSGTGVTLPAATNTASGVATAAQIVNLESLITLSGVAADALSLTTLVTGNIVQDNATLLQAIIDLEAGLEMATATQANLLDSTNAINTTGKFAGRKVRVTDRNDIVVFARGNNATDAWGDSSNIYEATPV